MVGKGETKSSRIFHQCYLKCCKLQNLTPLRYVVPTNNGKVVDFCVDRIKYSDWPPILNALSCDLSLHSLTIKCRQQVKTVLDHIDCERLAKTVNKRCVILTKFMLCNLVEAVAQLLTNTTLLSTLMLDGLPLRIPYLDPLCEALFTNNSLQHLHLSRCLIGDAGCLAICKAVRCLPNVLTLDLSGCELTPLGASYIGDLIKYQKIHRYSENWTHTLRYRLPDLDTMAGLRRISVCGNPQLGDSGVGLLLDVLSDDLWIKGDLISDMALISPALDSQNCGLTEDSAAAALTILKSNTTLVVLDLRYNEEISNESLVMIRTALRQHDRGMVGQFSWLASVSGSSSEKLGKAPVNNKNVIVKERPSPRMKSLATKYPAKPNANKKEKEYSEVLEEQLQEEISHRQQLEELNMQLVEQMKELKQQQMQLWANCASSGSEQSLEASSRSGELSNSSGSSSVPIDQNTLSYIQQAFRDIYEFIKNNQCHGDCQHATTKDKPELPQSTPEPIPESTTSDQRQDLRANMHAKKALSAHQTKLPDGGKANKITKSAHLLGEQRKESAVEKSLVIERHVGDTRSTHDESRLLEDIVTQNKPKMHPQNVYSSSSSSVGSDSDTLVCSPAHSPAPPALPSASTEDAAINPREALYSSSDDESS